MASRLRGHLENATQVSVIFTRNQNKLLARNFESGEFLEFRLACYFA